MELDVKENYKYYTDNQDALYEQYKDCYLIITNKSVYATAPTESEAYSIAIGKLEMGTFIIQKSELKAASKPQVFHSRVKFA